MCKLNPISRFQKRRLPGKTGSLWIKDAQDGALEVTFILC